MPDFVSFLISSILGGSVVSTVSTLLLERWKDRTAAKFNHILEQQMVLFAAKRDWKEQALVELYGPLVMQFDRTQRAFKRYQGNDLFLEAEVMKRSNEFIRDLLLTKGHFLSAELMDHAGQLVEHYDVWLAEYHRLRSAAGLDAEKGSEAQFETKPETNPETKFVFAGPQGYRFPTLSEQAFRDRFQTLQQDLYPGL